MRFIFTIILFLYTINSFSQNIIDEFKTGNQVLISDYDYLIKNKNLAIITNKSGIDKYGNHIIDMLIENNYKVKKIFTPEHGFSADDNYKSSKGNIPIISLYGNKYSFDSEEVNDIDVIIFDIQDLGARFYTYTSTLYLNMKEAKKLNKTFIVCDRPSISNANYISGFMLDNNFSSFVGNIPTPIMNGMTIGELANFLNGEYINNSDFYVINMKAYHRNSIYENLMKTWINPSPSISSIESARLYPALCFLEGTNISEGRGTDTPFQLLGAPNLNSDELISELNLLNINGVKFENTVFIPKQELLPGYTAMKFINKKCYGVKLTVTNFKDFSPIECSISILYALRKVYPNFQWTGKNFIDKLAGTNLLRKMIDNKNIPNDIFDSYSEDLKDFKSVRNKYLIYD